MNVAALLLQGVILLSGLGMITVVLAIVAGAWMRWRQQSHRR